MTRPIGKIIQINTCSHNGVVVSALLEDNSIWISWNGCCDWECILEPLEPEAQEPKKEPE